MTPKPTRAHLSRLMKIWRSAGWPSRDPIDIDLLAAGWVSLVGEHPANECLRLTDAGIALLAQSRQAQRRSESDHDKLALRMTEVLMDAGRLVWHELSLRAKVQADEAGAADGGTAAWVQAGEPTPLWEDDLSDPTDPSGKPHRWRLARPDLFSVRRTSNPNYLHPVVHEIKVSRADLLGELRRPAKSAAYRALCGQCWFVIRAGIARPEEIPPEYGVLVGHEHHLELARPAPRRACKPDFPTWMALARATPLAPPDDDPQSPL